MRTLTLLYLIPLCVMLTSIQALETSRTNISILYDKWFKQWGDYNWSDNVATNKAYAFETSYVIIDMIDENDIAGLEHIYEALQNDKEHDLIFLNGIIGEPTFEKEAIDKANFKALEFLFSNNIIDSNVKITDDTLQECTLLTYTNQKFQEAKTKRDSKSIANYEKILETLKEYEAK